MKGLKVVERFIVANDFEITDIKWYVPSGFYLTFYLLDELNQDKERIWIQFHFDMRTQKWEAKFDEGDDTYFFARQKCLEVGKEKSFEELLKLLHEWTPKDLGNFYHQFHSANPRFSPEGVPWAPRDQH